jgi:hypothetical protein
VQAVERRKLELGGVLAVHQHFLGLQAQGSGEFWNRDELGFGCD